MPRRPHHLDSSPPRRPHSRKLIRVCCAITSASISLLPPLSLVPLPAPSTPIISMPLTSPTTSFLPDLAHERATSPLFQASAFAFRSFPLLIHLPRPSPPWVINVITTFLIGQRLLHEFPTNRTFVPDRPPRHAHAHRHPHRTMPSSFALSMCTVAPLMYAPVLLPG